MNVWSKMQPLLTRYIFLPIFTLSTGSSYLSYFKKVKKEQWLKREEIEKVQLGHLKNILVWAYETTAYYKEIFDLNNFDSYNFTKYEELEKIPVLTKDIIRLVSRI